MQLEAFLARYQTPAGALLARNLVGGVVVWPHVASQILRVECRQEFTTISAGGGFVHYVAPDHPDNGGLHALAIFDRQGNPVWVRDDASAASNPCEELKQMQETYARGVMEVGARFRDLVLLPFCGRYGLTLDPFLGEFVRGVTALPYMEASDLPGGKFVVDGLRAFTDAGFRVAVLPVKKEHLS